MPCVTLISFVARASELAIAIAIGVVALADGAIAVRRAALEGERTLRRESFSHARSAAAENSSRRSGAAASETLPPKRRVATLSRSKTP